MHKTHPVQQKYSSSGHTLGLHAEVHACLSVSMADIKGAEIYVARLLKNGEIAMARPCTTCRSFLYNVGISKVYYTNNRGVFEELNLGVG